jgi:uncharacterized protein
LRLSSNYFKQITSITKMSLEEKIAEDLKTAMRAKDDIALRGIRAIKSAILLAKTDGSGLAIDEAREVQILQKLVKTRQESYDIFVKNGRDDLAKTEMEEINVIKPYLPQMMGEAEIEEVIKQIIAETGASSARDMGKVMGAANKQLAGKAEGRTISDIVKRLLA